MSATTQKIAGNLLNLLNRGLALLGLGVILKPRGRSNDRAFAPLGTTQQYFVAWTAKRLGIPTAVARERYHHSWNAFPGGHSGDLFEAYCRDSYQIALPFADDNPTEVCETYRLHQHVHFLRFLTGPDDYWEPDSPIWLHLPQTDRITVVDFGCGLAQCSRDLLRKLPAHDMTGELCLVDLPTLMKPFVQWVCDQEGIAHQFIESPFDSTWPEIPTCEVCIATEVFEHIYEPISLLHHLDKFLKPGGVLWTNLRDHEVCFQHVSPRLGPVRDELAKLGYEEKKPSVLYRKPRR